MVRERTIAAYFKNKVKDAGGWSVKISGEGVNGIPDYLVAIFEELILVETKSPIGKLSEIQKWVHQKFRKLGIPIYTVYTQKDVNDLIKERKRIYVDKISRLPKSDA